MQKNFGEFIHKNAMKSALDPIEQKANEISQQAQQAMDISKSLGSIDFVSLDGKVVDEKISTFSTSQSAAIESATSSAITSVGSINDSNVVSFGTKNNPSAQTLDLSSLKSASVYDWRKANSSELSGVLITDNGITADSTIDINVNDATREIEIFIKANVEWLNNPKEIVRFQGTLANELLGATTTFSSWIESNNETPSVFEKGNISMPLQQESQQIAISGNYVWLVLDSTGATGLYASGLPTGNGAINGIVVRGSF